MEIEIPTREEDVEFLPIVGNSQIHVEDGVTTGRERDKACRICWIYCYCLNSEGHRCVYVDIGLHSRGNFQLSSGHCKKIEGIILCNTCYLINVHHLMYVIIIAFTTNTRNYSIKLLLQSDGMQIFFKGKLTGNVKRISDSIHSDSIDGSAELNSSLIGTRVLGV